jgi:hypothetical protein
MTSPLKARLGEQGPWSNTVETERIMLIAEVEPVLEKVRRIMRVLGFSVVERRAPLVIVGKSDLPTSGVYRSDRHIIMLRRGADDLITLAHELCHSQQPDWNPACYKRDGSIDMAVWLATSQEQEAMAVEQLIRLPIYEIERAADALRAADIPVTAAWVQWVIRADIRAEKPHHISRKPRLIINRFVRGGEK